MISILHKKDCCGCSACVQRCPKQCITLIEDEEGFHYPKINPASCIDCGLCERVCPVIHQSELRTPQNVYAAINPNEAVRYASSSGGLFIPLAEQIIEAGGVVFGVKWNHHFEAVHAYTETKEGLVAFQGSKYLQSRVGQTFRQAEQFLKQGRQVLYSGTPCQIAALKLFLRKPYDNLLTIDFVCHGVPSPGVFRWYLYEEIKKKVSIDVRSNEIKDSALISSIAQVDVLAREHGYLIKDLSFRDKRSGWRFHSFVLTLQTLMYPHKLVTCSYRSNNNAYMCGFSADLYLRPSCHDCPAKSGKSGSDITLADYWGIEHILPDLDDNKGVSALIVNTEQGKQLLNSIGVTLHETKLEDFTCYNRAYSHSFPQSPSRTQFFAMKGKTFHQRIKKLYRLPLTYRIKLFFKENLKITR